jgi:hypothetical protein
MPDFHCFDEISRKLLASVGAAGVVDSDWVTLIGAHLGEPRAAGQPHILITELRRFLT